MPISYGPLARDVESLAIVMKALTNDSTMYELAPAIPPVPFRSEVGSWEYKGKGMFLYSAVSSPLDH